jgi:hypothetical protein
MGGDTTRHQLLSGDSAAATPRKFPQGGSEPRSPALNTSSEALGHPFSHPASDHRAKLKPGFDAVCGDSQLWVVLEDSCAWLAMATQGWLKPGLVPIWLWNWSHSHRFDLGAFPTVRPLLQLVARDDTWYYSTADTTIAVPAVSRESERVGCATSRMCHDEALCMRGGGGVGWVGGEE